jgi:Cu(I)/Ag(I) efflux system protein CusF
MKLIAAISLILALSASSLANAQSGGMDMKDRGNKPEIQGSKSGTHQMKAVVKAVDMDSGKVTLAHEPIKSLNWPPMTMKFSVKDKSVLDKLAVGQKVEADFVQQGSDYVVTRVK